MKKILSLIILCMIPLMGINAQETQMQEKQYLPEQGDWAIGVNVLPLFKYIGGNFDDSFGGGINGFTNDVSISGKYMLTDNLGIRANLGFMFGSDSDKEYSTNDLAVYQNPLSEDKVVDTEHCKQNGMSLNAGIEYRKGSKRVQGVFGIGVLFAFQSTKYTYDWGNEMTSINQRPSSSSFTNTTYNNGYRILEQKTSGSNLYAGLIGSIGVEWFVAPKISVGAEVNITAYYMSGAQSYTKREGYNSTLGYVEERTDLVSPGDKAFHFGTENFGGALNMTFYF